MDLDHPTHPTEHPSAAGAISSRRPAAPHGPASSPPPGGWVSGALARLGGQLHIHGQLTSACTWRARASKEAVRLSAGDVVARK
jgi:hypothetical protein